MLRVTEFVFYELAVKIHYLTEIADTAKFSGVWLSLWNARDALDDLFRQRALNFSSPAAWRLYNAITAIVPKEWNDVLTKFPKKSEDPNVVTEESDLPFWQMTELREAAKEFEIVLRTECQMMDTYFVSKKGTHSTKDLVENAHQQVPEPSRSKLPAQTKADFDQAGKCIGFDVPTAAAFHLLRGTEVVIREYYELVVPGPKRADPKMRSWGTYIRLLRNHGADKNILEILTHLKDVYRNPVLHPEENYTDERAQILLGVCISAVVLIIADIQQRLAKGGTLQFPASSAVAVNAP